MSSLIVKIKRENTSPYFLAELIRGVITIILLSLVIYGVYSLSFSKYILEDLMSNWAQYPLLDIKNTQNNTCDPGYQPLIKNEYWPGTTTGCKCLILLTTGTCDSKDYTCYTVWSRQARPLYYYRKSLLCAKPYPYNYYNLSRNIPRRSGECSSGYKSCGALDTMSNDLCIPESQLCPITDIKIVTEASLNQTSLLRKYNTVKLNDGNYLLFGNGLNETSKRNLAAVSNTPLNKVVVDLKLSEGDVCLNPYQKNTKFSQYKLINNRDAYYCTAQVDNILYDNRFNLIDNYNLGNLYSENNIMKIINDLPRYPMDTLNANMQLYTRNYIGIKYNCLNDDYFSPSGMQKNSVEISKIFSFQTAMLVFIIIISVYFFVYKIMDCKFYSEGGGDQLVICAEIVFIIFVLLFLFCTVLCFNSIGSTSHIFQNFKDMNCGDDLTNRIFINFGEKVASNSSIIFFTIISTLILLSIQPLFYFFLYLRFYKSASSDELSRIAAHEASPSSA